MAIRDVEHLLLGGGAATASAAACLRLEGAQGPVAIVSADDTLPYYRPSLSKQYLLGQSSTDQLLLNPASFYAEKNISVALNTQAVSLDLAGRIVSTSAGEQIRYETLLIATGSRPAPLHIPGVDLPGVHYLRTRAECEAVRTEATHGVRNAVVLGASFLGMEIAMSLIDLGLSVTIMECRSQVLPHVESAKISEYFRRHAEERGATVLLSDTITAIHGAGRVREVQTESGRRLPCDLLVVSIGVTPNTEFLRESGVALDAEGLVVVDDQLRTNAPNVFAAGDVTSFYDPVFARRRHIEHWDNAIKQGRLAARNMLGRRLRYDEVSYFFCDIGDVSFSMLGAPEEADSRVVRGSLASKSLAVVYLKDDVPRALFSAGRPVEETRSVEGLIRYRVNLSAQKDRLQDPGFALDQISTQTVLVLQGGGALGAFECGVVKALEEESIFPNIVAGVSIGALNGAIVASNPRQATAALESFWSEIAVPTSPLLNSETASAIASMGIAMFGAPNFFRPRWLPPAWNPLTPPASWTSFYDVEPMKALISRYVDFAALKSSPVRLLVGAVNVVSGKLEIFDSYVDDLTPDHVLASGSLPPGFPWTTIDGQAYWDGGIISNSPLDIVIDRCGPDGKQVYIVDLFADQRPLPTNLLEVMARRDEIVYSERVRSDLRVRELAGAYRRLVAALLDQIEPATQAKIRQRPLYIELMGDGAAMNVVRFVREGRQGEPSSRDYDFSDVSVRANQAQGYALAKKTLAEPPAPRTDLEAEEPVHAPPPSLSESDRLAPDPLGSRHAIEE